MKPVKNISDVSVNTTALTQEHFLKGIDTRPYNPILDIQSAIRLRAGLTNLVLRNDNYGECVNALYDIVGEFEANPNLVLCCPASLIEDLFGEYLLNNMYHSCKDGKITERILFLFRYLQGYHHTLEYEKKSLYFSVPEHISIAVYGNEKPLPPIKRLDMFTHFLGDFGLGAYAVVHGKDLLHIKTGLSALKYAEDKELVCAFLHNELIKALLFEMYEHLLTGCGRDYPGSLEYKFTILKMICEEKPPADYTTLLSDAHRIAIS